MRSPTEVQEDIMKMKCRSKIEIENLRHEHIIQEIEAMKKSKITAFVRNVREESKK